MPTAAATPLPAIEPALGLLELETVPAGIAAGDAMAKRAPIELIRAGTVHPGKYLVAGHPKSSTENERTTVVVRTASGTDVLFRQIAGALAKRIRWYVAEGDAVKQGEEFGFIKFGSRVDIFLPLDAQVQVAIGQHTTGGETVVAKLP